MAAQPSLLPAQQWQQFTQGLPPDLPDTAFDALRDKFFQEHVAQGVLAAGYGLEPARQQFMKETEREKSSWPRVELVAKKAAEAFASPILGLVGDQPARAQQRAMKESTEAAETEATKQGISAGLYSFIGENLGVAPYWMGAFGMAGKAAQAANATRKLETGINVMAGALTQGTYDAAKAPSGGRMMAGVEGAAIGGALVGVFEGGGALWRTLRSKHGLSEAEAKSVDLAAKGLADDTTMTEATKVVMSTPEIEMTIKEATESAVSGAKRMGVPLESPVERVNGRVKVVIADKDGVAYNLGGAVGLPVDDFEKILTRIADHLDEGGSVHKVGGSPEAVAFFQKKFEEVLGQRGKLDLGGLPNDTVRAEPKLVKEESFSLEGAPEVSNGHYQLPDELSGAKPRYGMRDNLYKLKFENDVDKALYIVAQASKSKADAKYVDWLSDTVGLEESSARSLGRTIRQQIKQMAVAAEPGTEELAVPSIYSKMKLERKLQTEDLPLSEQPWTEMTFDEKLAQVRRKHGLPEKTDPLKGEPGFELPPDDLEQKLRASLEQTKFPGVKFEAGEGRAPLETEVAYRETPLSHRIQGDIPWMAENEAKGATIPQGEGRKPTLMYAPDADKATLFHENLHGHFNYLGMDNWLTTHLGEQPIVHEIFQGAFSPGAKQAYLRTGYADEVFIHAASAARVGDHAKLEMFADANAGMSHLMDWLTDTSRNVLEKAATLEDSLHKRVLERRMKSVVDRTTGWLEDINTHHGVTGAEVDMVGNHFVVREPGKSSYFNSRDEMLSYLDERHMEALNVPELVDLSSLPEGLPRLARDISGPSVLKAPITTDPPNVSITRGDRPSTGGLTMVGRYFRPFYDWLSDATTKIERPDVFEAFHKIDKQVVEQANFLRPFAKELRDTLGQHKQSRQADFYRLFEAEPENKMAVAKELKFTEKELDDYQGFVEKFLNPLEAELGVPLETYVRQVVPRIRTSNYDLESVFPRMPQLGSEPALGVGKLGKAKELFEEALRTGEISPRDNNLLRVASSYARLGARKKYLADTLNDAAKLVDEKSEAGDYTLGLLQPSLKRHIEYLRGVPDHTMKVVNSIVGDLTQKANGVFEKMNKALPANLQIPMLEEAPADALSKLILFSYAGQMALRPAFLIQNSSQLFLTTLPILGNHLWAGLKKMFPLIKDGRESEIFQIPQKYGALVERSDLNALHSQGGIEESGGALTKFAQGSLNVLQYADNVNRIAAFWGHESMAREALESFMTHGDSKRLIKDSGMWFMKDPMRQPLVREAQLIGHGTSLDDVTYKIAKEMVEQTQWNYKRGANPGIYEYQLGRLFGQYGTWPLNYIEFARRFFDADHKVEGIKAGMRLVAIHGATLSAGQNAGVDLGQWLFTQPMAYGGGPALNVLTSIPKTLDFETRRGSEARSEIRRTIAPGLLPGGAAMERIFKAIITDDEHLWLRILGFNPLEEKEKMRGWHQLVP